jgi:glycosyltransferase involved in cell wall biosynthesis
MKKIAFITERNLNANRINGSLTRDTKLLKILKILCEVEIYYSDPKVFSKYEYLLNNNHINNEVVDMINSKSYSLVIISTFVISPYLNGYKNIRHPRIYYLCDSSYSMNKNTPLLKLKYKLITSLFKKNEYSIIKSEKCAYVGLNEINNLPKKYRCNAIIFPFYIDKAPHNYYDENGYILFLGDYKFWPNKDAFYKIIQIAEYISYEIRIFGSNIPEIKYLPSNFKIKGYAESLDDVYAGAKALIYPISYGTGIKNKVIEAMSYGIPVIGFKNAFTNMDVENRKNVVIIKKTSDIINVLENINLKPISDSAYSFIQNGMSKEAAINKIAKILGEYNE